MDFRNAEELHAGLYQQKEWWKRTYRKQLWYKRCRGKNVVRIDNDSDISALIHEYPFQYPSGKKKGREVHHVFEPPMWEIKVNQ